MLDFGAAANALLESDNVRIAVLCRIATDTPTRFWTGVGDLALPADAVETTDGAIYKGIGDIVGLPALDQLINGGAQAVQFTISGTGVDAAGVAMLTASAEDVIYRRMNVGIGIFDANLQFTGNRVWLWEGECSTIDASREANAGPGGLPVRTVSLGVGSTFTARRRPRIVNWTDTHQRRISATDDYLEYVHNMSAGTTIKWP